MSSFINDDFLLETETAKELFSTIKDLPIIDYHNHVNPEFLTRTNPFENLFQLWIRDDPYKHRAMRILGIPEELITGNASDKDKFFQWAEVFPDTIGNPLFHWSCMEMKRFFGIDEILTKNNVEDIWNHCNKIIQASDFNAVNILRSLNVEILITSDELLDNLHHHTNATEENDWLTVKPSLRPDAVLNFSPHFFHDWIKRIEKESNLEISDLESYKTSIRQHIKKFNKAGCLIADQGLLSGFIYSPTNFEDANKIFRKQLNGIPLFDQEIVNISSHLLEFLCMEYYDNNWAVQFHIGAKRDTNSTLRKKLGTFGGYASIGNSQDIDSLVLLLDGLDKQNKLPKVIIYNLNPADNAKFATLSGSFAKEGIRGNVQMGPAWWYNDTYDGNIDQIKSTTNYSLLSTSIGMTTDSRSVLSFVRHEYYRRILCNQIGIWVSKGHFPNDFKILENLAKNIAYNNIKNWIK